MMDTQRRRMSPWTALFLGGSGVVGLIIVSAASIVLYGMSIADRNVSSIVQVATNSVDDLPGWLVELPELFEKVFNDRRALEYADSLDFDVTFVTDARGVVTPALTIRNTGRETVSYLSVRVAALNEDDIPVGEWTELVATPVGIEEELRGLLLPGATRHVMLDGRWKGKGDFTLKGVTEVSDIRVRKSNATADSTEQADIRLSKHVSEE